MFKFIERAMIHQLLTSISADHLKLTCTGFTSNMTDEKVFTANVGYQCRIAEHAQNPIESDETRQSNETDIDTLNKK